MNTEIDLQKIMKLVLKKMKTGCNILRNRCAFNRHLFS